MNKALSLYLIASLLLVSNYTYNGSTTAPVILAGAIIKSKHTDKDKKYPRKDCPVCKGKGWYLSGDGIKKIECGYCELESQEESQIIHPPVVLEQDCETRTIKQ